MEPSRAEWVDVHSRTPGPGTRRLYVGDETCARRLPAPDDLREFCLWSRDAGLSVTLVTPFVTDSGMADVLRAVAVCASVSADPEVVCSDWGVLERVAALGGVAPVLGRVLAFQCGDPRAVRLTDARPDDALPRRVTHLDGTECQVRRRSASAALVEHLRRTWVDRPRVKALLESVGVRRAEVSYPLQGLTLTLTEGRSWSVHVPWALLSVMRRCPSEGEEFSVPRDCPSGACCPEPVTWSVDIIPEPVVRRGNALYVRSALPPGHVVPEVDRVVYDTRAC
jgi:hypothetical protein